MGFVSAYQARRVYRIFFCCGCNHNKAKRFWETPLLLDLPYIAFFGLFIYFLLFFLLSILYFLLPFLSHFLSLCFMPNYSVPLHTHTFIGKKVHVKNFQKKTETISLVTTKSKWKWQTHWLQSIDCWFIAENWIKYVHMHFLQGLKHRQTASVSIPIQWS